MGVGALAIASAGYISLLLAVAFFSGRKGDNRSYFTAGRRTPWPIAAISMVGAAITGISFISVPGSVAGDAFSYLQMTVGFIIGYFIIAFVLIPLFYRYNVVSLYQYLQMRFGGVTHVTGAAMFFISKILGTSLRAYLLCTVFQMLIFDPLNIPFGVNVALFIFLVWLYTVRGGVKTVVWTDILKTVCMVATLVLIAVFILDEMGLTMGEAARSVADHPFSRIWFTSDWHDGRFVVKKVLAGIFMVIAMTGLDQDMMQRTLSCPNPRSSQKNMIVSVFLQSAVIFLLLAIGVLFYIFLASRGVLFADGSPLSGIFPMMGADSAPLVEKPDQVFPYVAVGGGLSGVVGLLFVVGLVASTYSSTGSSLTSMTTSFVVDVLCNSMDGDQKVLARRRRVTHAAVAVALFLGVLCFEHWGSQSLINVVYAVASYSYGPILGMFAFGILTKRKIRDKFMPAVAVAAPLLSFVLQSNSQRWFGGYQIGFELLVINAAITFVGMLLLSIGKHTE